MINFPHFDCMWILGNKLDRKYHFVDFTIDHVTFLNHFALHSNVNY